MNPPFDQPGIKDKLPLSQENLKELLESIKSIKYGSLTLIIQDGRVVQIDKKEKKRLT